VIGIGAIQGFFITILIIQMITSICCKAPKYFKGNIFNILTFPSGFICGYYQAKYQISHDDKDKKIQEYAFVFYIGFMYWARVAELYFYKSTEIPKL
jgi:hypothetical protein